MTKSSVLGMLVPYSTADNQHDYVFMNSYVTATLTLWTLQTGTICKKEEYVFQKINAKICVNPWADTVQSGKG